MKFFIVALLVAAAAGQTTMDLLKFQKEKALLNKFERPIMRDLLMKKMGYPLDKTMMYGDNMDFYGQDEYLNKDMTYPVEGKQLLEGFKGIYDYDYNQVLTVEELYQTQLFREYMRLPLFRQYFQYPSFQRYVASTYFQKFWQIPTFRQYFLNPVLFYKYIYPIVNLFKTDITIPTTTVYGEIENKNAAYPYVTGLLKDKPFVPTYYNQELKFKNDLLIKNILVKIYSHLYEIPEELVKEHFFKDEFTYPVDTFKTFEKTIYGDKLNYPVDTFKTFEKTIYGDKLNYPVDFDTYKTYDHTIFGDKLNKDVLKKMLLKKMMYGDETMKTILPEEVMLKEKMMSPLVSRMIYGYNKIPTTYKFETFDKTFDTVDKMNMFDIDMKKEEFLPLALKKELLLKDKILYNKIFNDKVNEIDTFGTYETIPKVVDFTTPMMGIRKFEKKIFPETMIKA